MPIGPTELILILVIVLVIFGAGKLPQVFSQLGRGVREFRDASEGKDATTTTTTTTTDVPANTAPPQPYNVAPPYAPPPAQQAPTPPYTVPPGTSQPTSVTTETAETKNS